MFTAFRFSKWAQPVKRRRWAVAAVLVDRFWRLTGIDLGKHRTWQLAVTKRGEVV